MSFTSHKRSRGRVDLANSLESAQMLLDAGADINAVDNSGKTALHHLTTGSTYYWNEMLAVADLLVCKGIDRDRRDKNGKTAAELFQEAFNKSLDQSLYDFGQK